MFKYIIKVNVGGWWLSVGVRFGVRFGVKYSLSNINSRLHYHPDAVPDLLKAGFSAKDIQAFLVDNPARFFA